MAGKLDQIIVIDLESTCWEGQPPEGQENEIIEIGVCTLDVSSGRRLHRQSILVKPERSEVSPFCTDLTTLTQSQVNQGVPFAHACAILRRKYAGRDRVWASYGDYDRKQMEKQCLRQEIDYPLGNSHINIKSLLALVYGLPREIGMLKSMQLLSLPVEGVHHRGVDDAWNTALILSKLILQCRGGLVEPES